MTLRFNKTRIYFKLFYSSAVLNKDAFTKLCKKIYEFPLKEDYPEIKGLFLKGEHFFKKMLLSDAEELGTDEIRHITSIKPIVDHTPMPFIMEDNYFEVLLSTEGKSFEELMENITVIDKYLDDLFEEDMGRKIEIHLKGGAGAEMNRQIYGKIIPDLSFGDSKYEALLSREVDEGDIYLPKPYSDLPEGIKKMSVGSGNRTFKLIMSKDINNKLILRSVKKQEIGFSLYSDESEWFKNILRACENKKLFGQPLLPQRYKSLPHLTGPKTRISL